MKRVALLVGSMNVGGAERVAATMANAWVAQQKQVWLIPTYLPSRSIKFDLHPAVQVEYLRDRVASQGRWWLPDALRKVVALRSLLCAIRPDVVVSFLTNVNVLAVLALRGTNTPIALSERSDPAADIELPYSIRIARHVVYRFADALVVQTDSAARRYQKRLWRVPEITVIPNPLPSGLAVSAARADQSSQCGLIISLGRLTVSKRFERLIRAFKVALAKHAGWRLEIWGDGPLRDRLERLVRSLGLAESVRLCGATSEPWAVLASGQVFALSSDYEGFPNAMLEAMSIGLACVAFDCPSGPRDLSDNGVAAIIVPPGDQQQFTKELVILMHDRTKRAALGAAAAEFVRRRYSERDVMARWNSLLEAIIDQRLPEVGAI